MSNFYELLKQKVDELQAERELQDFIEWNFKSAKANVESQKNQIEKNQKSFFAYIAELWESNVPPEHNFHFPPPNNKRLKKNEVYSLPEYLNFLNTLTDDEAGTKVKAYFDELKKIKNNEQFLNAILPIFLSPLSINYFHNAFNEIMMPHFTAQVTQSYDDQFINNLSGSLLTSLHQNMCYCPSYLIKLLTLGNDFFAKFNLTAVGVFRKFALDILFLRPDLFGIEFTPDNTESLFQILDNQLNLLAENFLYILDYQKGFELLHVEDKYLNHNESRKAFDSTVTINGFGDYFRQLLKISPKLPDKLPVNLIGKNYKEIVFALVVRPGPQFFKRSILFNKMEENENNFKGNTKRINPFYKDSLSEIKVAHETEKIAELSNLSIHLSHAHQITCKIANAYRQMTLRLAKSKELPQNESTEYINEPQKFITIIQNLESSLMKCKNKLPGIFGADNIYKNLIKDIKFDTFISLRKDILTADRSLNTILQSYRYHRFDVTALQDFQKHNKRNFDELRNNFVAAFCESTDPLTKARKISNVYSEIVRRVKSQVGIDVDNLEEEERNVFIFSVFCLMNPTKVISVYVFLTEFVFHSNYNKIIEKTPYKNEIDEIKLAKNVLRSLISFCSKLDIFEGGNGTCPNFLYQCTSLARICQKNINLTVKYDDREQLALMSDSDYSMGNKTYDEVKKSVGADSLIDYFKRIDSSKHIILRIYHDDNTIYICNISFTTKNDGVELSTDRSELIKQIEKLANEK